MTIQAEPTDHPAISRRALSLLMLGGVAVQTMAAETGKPSHPPPPVGVSIEDLAEIEQLHCRHSRALDERNPQAFMECFAPGVLSEEVVEKVMAFFRRFESTVHSVVNPIYRVTGNEATGTAFCIVTFVKNQGGRRSAFETISKYRDDQLTKRHGLWVFLKHHRTSLYSTQAVEIIEGDPLEVTQAIREIFG